MRMPWWLSPQLHEEAGEPTSLSPGTEVTLDDDPPPKPEKTEEKPDLKALQDEIENLKTRATRAEQDRDYWAGRARRPEPTAPKAEPKEPPKQTPNPYAKETPEQLIDALAKEGFSALSKRGLMTKDEVAEMLREQREGIEEHVETVRADATFEQRLASEFPEIVAESNRIKAGEAPSDPLWIESARIYREMVEVEPSLEHKKSTLLLAARQAKQLLEKHGAAGDDGDPKPSRQQERRQRIEAGAPPRGSRRAPQREQGEPAGLDDSAKAVLRNLRDAGADISEEDVMREASRRG